MLPLEATLICEKKKREGGWCQVSQNILQTVMDIY
jgi:hypothetical protein